jgi:predicted O-methyltransferase YrrM
MIRGYQPSRCLLTALELDFFTAVGSGASATDVANRVGTNLRATEMLLNVLVSLRLLEKKDGVFLNTPRSARFLAEGSRDSARDGLMHIANLWPRWSALTDCVRTGQPAKKEPRDESAVHAFIAAMDRNAREGTLAVLQAVGTENVRRILDLGGGSGAYAIAFAKAVPELQAEIMDLPEVVPLTKEYIRKLGLENRITVRSGDMLSDPLGQDYDLVLLSAICHMFSPEQNRALFRRAYDALSPNGRLVIRDFILEPDKTAPRFGALFSLNMLVGTQGGSSYSEPEYAAWLRDAGFTKVDRVRLPGPSGLMVAEK